MSKGQRSRPTGLDDELGALVAGEQRHVHDAALHIGAVLVHDGVELSVAHWGVKGAGGGGGGRVVSRGLWVINKKGERFHFYKLRHILIQPEEKSNGTL